VWRPRPNPSTLDDGSATQQAASGQSVRNLPAESRRQLGIRGPVQRRLHSIAASQNAVLVDVDSTFNGDTTTLVDCGGLHPTAAGYQRIVDTSSTRFSKRSSWRRRQLPPA